MTHDQEQDTEPLGVFSCPNCKAPLTEEMVGIFIFETAIVYHCPVCKKTMALMPRPKQQPPGDDGERGQDRSAGTA